MDSWGWWAALGVVAVGAGVLVYRRMRPAVPQSDAQKLAPIVVLTTPRPARNARSTVTPREDLSRSSVARRRRDEVAAFVGGL